MSPDNAQIFLVNDHQRAIRLVQIILKGTGHEIVDTASSVDEALSKIPSLEQKKINVALIDGNLSEYSKGGIDGEKIAQAIKDKFPKIKVNRKNYKNLTSCS